MTARAALDVALLHVPKPEHVTPELGRTSFVNFMPFGLMSIASNLERSGFHARIFHLGLERIAGELEDLPQRLRRAGVRVVGISLHWHPSTFDALETARWLRRELPEVVIVFGGITASFFAEQLLAEPAVDHVIEGDGEIAMAALVRELLHGGDGGLERLPNLWYRGVDGKPARSTARHVDGAPELSLYDFGCFHLVEHAELLPYMNWAVPTGAPLLGRLMRRVQDLRPRLKPLTFYQGRGCPIDCPICGGNRVVMGSRFGRSAFVAIPPRTLLQAAQRAIELGFSHLASDTSFGITRLDILEQLEAFDDADFRPWWSMSLPMIPSLDVAQALARVTRGRCWLSLTAESGSERVRRRFRGPAAFGDDELFAFLARMEEARIPTQVVLSVNLPLDPESAAEHRAASRALRARLKRSRWITPVNFNVQLDPGSAMYRNPDAFHCEAHWRSLADYHDAHRRVDPGPGFSSEGVDPGPWGRRRTHQVEHPEAIVLSGGFRLASGLERGARRFVRRASAAG